MMLNFTPHAQHQLAFARKEADRLNHSFVGSEHLVLGLIKLGQGLAVTTLQRMGLDLDTLRMQVEQQAGTGPEARLVGKTPYTPRVKKILALALKEAKELNHTYVGTEHILIAILREGESVAAVLLDNLKVNLERTRNLILQELDPNLTPPEGRELDDDERSPTLSRNEWFDHMLEDHPAIRLIVAERDEVRAEKELAIKEQDFEKAAHLRDKEKGIRREIQKEKQRLRESLERTRSLSLTPILRTSFDEVLAGSMFPTGKPAATVADAVLAGKAVLVVASDPCDDSCLSGPLVAELHCRSLASSNLEVFVLRPNHVALIMSEPESYQRNLEEAVDALIAHRNLVVLLADIATLLDADCMDPRIATAWQSALNRLNANHQPFIAWTDSAGLQKIHKNWPGIFSECTSVEIHPPDAGQITEMVSLHLEKSSLSFKKGDLLPFARKLVEHCEAHADELPWNEPERSLRIAEQFTLTAKAENTAATPLTLRDATRILGRITA